MVRHENFFGEDHEVLFNSTSNGVQVGYTNVVNAAINKILREHTIAITNMAAEISADCQTVHEMLVANTLLMQPLVKVTKLLNKVVTEFFIL